MFKSFKYRIYPTEVQKVLLEKHFGCVRFIYNLALETKSNAYDVAKVNLSAFDLIKQMVEMKKEFTFLNEVNSQSLQMPIRNLDFAYTNFFKKNKGYPKFKRKSGHQSFQCPQFVNVKASKIFIPKFREGIKIELHREFKGDIKTVTISKTPTGKYFASILVDNKQPLPERKPVSKEGAIGIDFGLKSFAVLSNGEVFDNPKYLRESLSRLKVLQQRASKKKKGSANRRKANLKVALLHEKVANQRKDFLHKFSSAITKRFDVICVEDLNIAGMKQSHKLALSINDVSWSEAIRKLTYKSDWQGGSVLTCGMFDASSKVHNVCGYKNEGLTLADRTWLCPICNETVNRDLNAAINIVDMAFIKHSGREPSGEPVEVSALAEPVKQEKFGIIL